MAGFVVYAFPRISSGAIFICSLWEQIENPLAAMVFTIHLLRTYPDLPVDAHELVERAGEMLNRISDSVRKVLIESRPVA